MAVDGFDVSDEQFKDLLIEYKDLTLFELKQNLNDRFNFTARLEFDDITEDTRKTLLDDLKREETRFNEILARLANIKNVLELFPDA